MISIKKTLRRMMSIVIGVIILVGLLAFFVLRQPQFGKAPSGERLERIKQSPNYKDGKFQNLSYTPSFTEGHSMAGEVYQTFFKKHPRKFPTDSIPTLKTDLLLLHINENMLVWFGHSSYFMQLDGKRFLVDPVLSGSASPLPFGVKAFQGTDIYAYDDLPEIDYLLISHDHFDHLDYKTIKALQPKIKQVICGLGVGEHFEYWGFDPKNIIEKDWNESVVIQDNFTIYTTPARHFSGRSLSRNNTLWMSFVLDAPSMKIFVGGDSGYDTHFAAIGEQFGPFDLAILENGQYNEAWRGIHTMPEDFMKVVKDLQAQKVFPVHSSKFVLARHPWDEPLIKISELCQATQTPLITPMIGEKVRLNDPTQTLTAWWKGVN